MNENSTNIKLLIVEDEVLLAQDIALRLSKLKYQVVSMAHSAEQAIELLKAHSDIDVVILDIMIHGDKDGIDLAKIINTTYHIPFIFLTSHADKQIVARAKKVNPYSYLLKPFNDRQISIAIEMALSNFSKNAPVKDLLKEHKPDEQENEILKIKDSLFLKKNNRYERVYLSDILFLEADSNYTTIYTKADKFIYSMVLKKLEEKLPKTMFLRVHRSYIVNMQSVEGFEGNQLNINNQKVPVSKSHHNEVFSFFKVI